VRRAKRHGERNPGAKQIPISHPHTSGREYAYDDGCGTTVAAMITIDFYDGNRILARQVG
jgi:hypothetical protein